MSVARAIKDEDKSCLSFCFVIFLTSVMEVKISICLYTYIQIFILFMNIRNSRKVFKFRQIVSMVPGEKCTGLTYSKNSYIWLHLLDIRWLFAQNFNE